MYKLFSIFLLLSFNIQAETIALGEITPPVVQIKSTEEFSANLSLVADEKKFAEEWLAPDSTAKLTTINEVKSGDSIVAIIIFTGCEVKNGICDVTTQYTVEQPDKKIVPFAEQQLWKAASKPKGVFMVGESILKNNVESTDPTGIYRLTATVKDNNSGKVLTITNQYTVSKWESISK